METGTLRALKATETTPLSPKRSLAILRAVSDSLFPLHAAGQAYGAFGPDSVLVDADGARLAPEPTYDEAYAAPELRAGGEPTPASDAFAYAMLAHRLLAGDEPLFGRDGVPLPITDQHPGFPAFAAETIARALQPDPAKRPLPKVLDTLLQVVPVDRWPSAYDKPVADASPAVAEDGPVLGKKDRATVPHADAGGEETNDLPQQALGRAADRLREARDDEFRQALAPQHAVPDIGWSHPDTDAPDSRTLIDWTAGSDPTRPSHEVPEIRWTPRALHGGPDPLTDELEILDAPLAEEPADPIGDAIDEAIGQPVEPVETGDAAEPAAPVEQEPDEEVEDVARVAEQPEDIRAYLTGSDEEATEDAPVAELAGEPAEDEDHLDAHLQEGRVRSTRRRSRRHLDAAVVQKIALVAILLLILAAGLVYFLTHRDGPTYDPTLQGASRSLSQPAAARE